MITKEQLKQKVNLLTDEEIIVNLLGIIASIGDTPTNLYWKWNKVLGLYEVNRTIAYAEPYHK